MRHSTQKSLLCLPLVVLVMCVALTMGLSAWILAWLESIVLEAGAQMQLVSSLPAIYATLVFISVLFSITLAIGTYLALRARRIKVQYQQFANELKQRERNIRRETAAAQASSAAKSELLQRISHNIRSPITSIMGICELLSSGHLSPTTQQQHAQTAKVSAEHLLSLANELLDLAQLEAGKAKINRKEFDLVHLVKDVALSHEPIAVEKGLKLVLGTAIPESVVVCSDPTRLREILSNLLDNAIKYTHAGSITLTVEPNTPHETFRILVADTGPGIDQDIMPRLFEPFEQLTPATSSEPSPQGVGLGLAITRHLVSSLGGNIHATSVPDTGSTFIVELPGLISASISAAPKVFPASADTHKALALQPSHSQNQRHEPLPIRVLVVDDAPEIVRLLDTLLTDRGCAVTTAHTLAEALVHCEQANQQANTAFVCIFLDLHLDEPLNLAAVKAIRQLAPHAQLVAMTADPSNDLLRHFDHHVPKPFTSADLMGILTPLLADHTDQAEAA